MGCCAKPVCKVISSIELLDILSQTNRQNSRYRFGGKNRYICFMDKVVRITSLKDKQTDFTYWMTKSETERLDAIELLREQYIRFKKNVQPGLQRVCSVINRKKS